jgi:hypothetical protein
MLERNPNIAIYFHVHLVSDSTGETLVAMMKASTAQFRSATALEHLHALVRSEAQLEHTLEGIESGKIGSFLSKAEYPGCLCSGSNIVCLGTLSWRGDDR